MKIAGKSANIFKIKNRRGYACVCGNHLTEGGNSSQAAYRMEKALRRKKRKN